MKKSIISTFKNDIDAFEPVEKLAKDMLRTYILEHYTSPIFWPVNEGSARQKIYMKQLRTEFNRLHEIFKQTDVLPGDLLSA